MTSEPIWKSGPTKILADGAAIPTLALGLWQVPDGQQCVDAVRSAIELGYRHIDTAQGYGNEGSVGQALKQCGIPREEIFVTTKFLPKRQDPVAELMASLERLMLDYVDLYLVHWPQGGPEWAWPGMERARESECARSIGVSNFDSDELQQVLAIADSPPVVNQIQLNPFHFRESLVNEGLTHGLTAEAYSPLGTGRHLAEPNIQAMAARNGMTTSQVLITWGLMHQFVVLSKSTHREHLAENLRALKCRLSDTDMAELDSLDAGSVPGRALEKKWW